MNENKIYEKYIKPLEYKDSIGGIYILKNDIDKMNIPEEEYTKIIKTLKEKNIPLVTEIKTNERPSLVRNFEYGTISETKMNPSEENKYIQVTYDKNGEVENVDYSLLEQYLDDIFIPEKIHIKVRLKDKYGPEYYSIQLNEIVKLKLSEIEFKHTLDYLKEQGIIVCGTSEYPEDNFENYDYWYRIKNIQIPDAIDKDETKELFTKLKECDDLREKAKIRDQIITGNMRLAKWVIYKMSPYYGIDNTWETYAYEGLINAVDNFDNERTSKYNSEKIVSFSTYAVIVIKNLLIRRIADFYKMPNDILSDFIKAKNVVEANYDRKYKNGDKEMLEEILDLLYNIGIISEHRKKLILNRISLEKISFEDEKTDTIYNNEDIETLVDNKLLREKLLETLETLDEKRKETILKRYGLDGNEPMTLQEIGDILGVGRNRIRNLEADALRKLKISSKLNKLNDGYVKGYNFETTNPKYGYMEPNPSNPDWDDYEESDQQEMESDTYKDPLYELEEFYKEERNRKK